MAIGSTTHGRVSQNALTELTLRSVQRSQAALARAQVQLASGKAIQAPSEDPVLAGRLIDLADLIGRIGQYDRNADYANSYLGSVDSTLAEAVDLLREAHTLALDSIGSTASDAERAGNAQLIDSLTLQLQRVANRSFQGRFLFDGLAGAGQPFVETAGSVHYVGSEATTPLVIDPSFKMSLPLDGASVFGGLSADVTNAVDLDPSLSAQTAVADLYGATGGGVTLGQLRVSDGVNPTVVIDLSSAVTVGDVIDLFNDQAPPNLTMSLNVAGDGLALASTELGADITVAEVASGATAAQLGILETAGGGSAVVGDDLDPRLTETTALGLLNAGAGFDAASGLLITNGTLAATVDLSAAQTLQDVLGRINQANVGVRASIADDGRSIELVNALSGTELKVVENGGSTAGDLGLRTFHTGLLLAGLNGGRGIDSVGDADDLRITQRDGTTIDVNLDTARTIGDVIDLINNDAQNGGDLLAAISATGGIELLDSSTDAGSDLAVAALNASAAPGQLGLVKSVANPGDTLTGDDVSGARTEGVFSHLAGLHAALTGNDSAAITRMAASLEQDLNRLIELRGTTGAFAQQAQQQAGRLESERLDTETLKSELGDLDFAEAVVRFQQLQTQLTASLTSAGRLLNLSLLDFLR